MCVCVFFCVISNRLASQYDSVEKDREVSKGKLQNYAIKLKEKENEIKNMIETAKKSQPQGTN